MQNTGLYARIRRHWLSWLCCTDSHRHGNHGCGRQHHDARRGGKRHQRSPPFLDETPDDLLRRNVKMAILGMVPLDALHLDRAASPSHRNRRLLRFVT